MKELQTIEEDYVRFFVDSLGLGHRDAAKTYREISRHLLHFVHRKYGRMDLSQRALVAWIKERSRHCAVHRTAEWAQMANRFLVWLKSNGHIPRNPLEELRSQYGGRLEPIVRALLSPGPKAALEKLRPLPVFASALGPLMREHLNMIRSLGYRHESAEGKLRRFDRFLQGRRDLSGKPLPQLIDAWRKAGTTLHHALEAQQCGRMLSKVQARHDPTATVIPSDPQLWRRWRASHRRPYIYTEQEVAKLLETSRRLPSRPYPLRPWSAYTMLLLAYCAGLRIQEVVNLNLGDVDLTDGTITIRNSKFFRSRCLPLQPGVLKALRDYIEERRKAGAPTDPEAGLFWNRLRWKRYTRKGAQHLLTMVLRRSGIKVGQGRTGPRIHDLRHAMVSNRMLRWYREGINPQSRLAHLSTFMGHTDIQYTLHYLTLTPELLELASERFRRYAVHVLDNAECRP